MKIYDITQELFTCCVFPGDQSPVREQVRKIQNGDICNLTNLTMCAHNGTHVDAPYHFYEEGKTIERMDLSKVIGDAKVIPFNGEITETDVERMMDGAPKRILLKGRAIVTLEAARAFNRYGIQLIGVESQTVGPEDAPKAVHLELLGKEVVLLEGLRLEEVPEGCYFLNAAPVKLGGADGAPCRAVLLEGINVL